MYNIETSYHYKAYLKYFKVAKILIEIIKVKMRVSRFKQIIRLS